MLGAALLTVNVFFDFGRPLAYESAPFTQRATSSRNGPQPMSAPANDTQALVELRQKIDAIDAEVHRLLIDRGAAPEVLVEEVIDGFAERFDVTVRLVTTAAEDMTFALPRQLRDAAE